MPEYAYNTYSFGLPVEHVLKDQFVTLCGHDFRDSIHEEELKPWWERAVDEGTVVRRCGACAAVAGRIRDEG